MDEGEEARSQQQDPKPTENSEEDWSQDSAPLSEDRLPLSGYISNPFMVFLNSLQQIFKVNLKTLGVLIAAWLGLVIVGIGLMVTLAFMTRNTQIMMALLLGAGFLLVILLIVLQVATIKYALETARGQTASFKACLRTGRRKALGFIGLSILLGLTLLVGFLLLIIPGLIFLYWFILAPFVYIDEDVGIIEAMKLSKSYSQGNATELFGVYGAMLAISLPGVVPLLGSLYSLLLTPVTQIGLSYRYVSFRAAKTAQLQKGETHSANFVAIALIPVLVALMLGLSLIFGPGNQPSSEPFPSESFQHESSFPR